MSESERVKASSASSGRALLVCALLGCGACERARPEFAFVDTPEAAPAGEPVDVPTLVAKMKEGNETEPSAPDGCERWTGRTPEGTCVDLATRRIPHGQQVQLPSGTAVIGFIPDRGYDGTQGRETPAVLWSGQPPRHVDVESFWIDLFEVTRDAYQACVDADQCTPARCPEGLTDPALEEPEERAGLIPQTCVTHSQAAAYCAAQGWRLPTEVEWEYAARGVDARRFPWGNEIEDTMPPGLYPAGRLRADSSYFNILGLGTNATEWVADVYDPDAGLRPFLEGEFRDPEGPVRRARREFELRAACGDAPEPGCRARAASEPARHVYKHGIAGARRAGRDVYPANMPQRELEDWPWHGNAHRRGFRCADDRDPARDIVLTAPAQAVPVPTTRIEGSVTVFGGVAEAVNRDEAARFCELLAVTRGDGQVDTEWRLPSIAEIEQLAAVFRGPGPVWASDGAVAQVTGFSPPDPTAPWETVAAEPGDALIARCVHD